LAKYWLKDVIVSKVIPSSLLPPVSLVVICHYFIFAHWQMSQSPAIECVTNWAMESVANCLFLKGLILLFLIRSTLDKSLTGTRLYLL